MNFIKNLFKSNNKEEETQVKEQVEKKEPKRTMPEVNGKELYKIEKEKRRAEAKKQREAQSKADKEARELELAKQKEREAEIKQRLEEERQQNELTNEQPKKQVKNQKPKEEEKLEMFGFEIDTLKQGMEIEVEIISEEQTGYIVNATKYFQEAFLPKQEIEIDVALNDRINVLVYRHTNEDFHVSHRRNENKRNLEKVMNEVVIKDVVTGKVVDYKNNFFTVEFNDKKGEVYIKNMDIKFVNETDEYLNNEYRFIIKSKRVKNNKATIELDRRALLFEEQKNAIANLNIDNVIEVREFTPNKGGINFNYNGIQGFVPLAEIAYKFYGKSENAMRDLDALETVKISKIEKRRSGEYNIIGSIKATKENPWNLIEKNYEVEDRLTREVVRKEKFGLFFEIDYKIQGLLHQNEMSNELATEFANVEVGDTVTFFIKEINLTDKKIALTNITM